MVCARGRRRLDCALIVIRIHGAGLLQFVQRLFDVDRVDGGVGRVRVRRGDEAAHAAGATPRAARSKQRSDLADGGSTRDR